VLRAERHPFVCRRQVPSPCHDSLHHAHNTNPRPPRGRPTTDSRYPVIIRCGKGVVEMIFRVTSFGFFVRAFNMLKCWPNLSDANTQYHGFSLIMHQVEQGRQYGRWMRRLRPLTSSSHLGPLPATHFPPLPFINTEYSTTDPTVR